MTHSLLNIKVTEVHPDFIRFEVKYMAGYDWQEFIYKRNQNNSQVLGVNVSDSVQSDDKVNG